MPALNIEHMNDSSRTWKQGATGATGATGVSVTLSKGTATVRLLKKVWVSAPNASVDATLVVNNKAGSDIPLTGALYLAALPADKGIMLNDAVTDVKVVVTSTNSSAVYVNVEYDY